MNFYRLKNFSNEKTKRLRSILLNLNLDLDLDLDNIFNPCYKKINKKHYISFRANSKLKYDSIESFILTLDQKYKIVNFTNISELYEKDYGIYKVSDPKLCILNKLLFLTFNTGPCIDGNRNDIYLAEINEDFPKPKKCIYEKRMLMEKNWAFYIVKNKLMVLYSLKPMVTLEAFLIEKDKIIFRNICDLEGSDDFSKGLSIGSDIQKINDKYFLIAHEKIFLHKKKRIYFGRLVCLSLLDKKFKIIKIYPQRYIHSYRSLLGTIKKRNKNLISCTYFSGFTYDKNKNTIIFSYGINDFYFSFAAIPFKSII